MPRGRKKKDAPVITEPVGEFSESSYVPTALPKWAYPALIVLTIVALSGIYLWNNKGLVLSAIVNNRPVWRWEVISQIENKYSPLVLDSIISDKLILQASAQKGLVVSPTEVKDRIAEIEKRFAPQGPLKDLLAQRGMTEEDLREKILIQIYLEKLTADRVKVSDKDVEDYVSKNKSFLVATTAAEQAIEARETLLNQQREVAFNELLDQLKKDAKIVKF